MKIERVVVWFSSGVTSAWAAKLTLDRYKGLFPVHLVNTDTGSEHEDNYRFMADVENWLDTPVEIIRNEKYANTYAVYDEHGYMKNQYGATCTRALKRDVRRGYENLQTDLQIFGYDAAQREKERAVNFTLNNPEVTTWFPLIENGITKMQARVNLLEVGIKEPITYSLGFANANCLGTGCIKGGIGYWNHYRRVFPDRFWRMARKERELGFSILMDDRLIDGKRVKVPLFLDELEPDRGHYKSEPEIVCGLFCGNE